MRLEVAALGALALGACFTQPDPLAFGDTCPTCADAAPAPESDAAVAAQPPVSELPGSDAGVSFECIGTDLAAAPILANANGRFLATGVNRRTTFSNDGVHWQTNDYVAPLADAAPSDGDILATATAPGMVVAAASIGIMASPDGLTWSAQSVPETRPYVHYEDGYAAAAFGKGLFVVASGPQFNPLAIFHSTDGITWEPPTVVDEAQCCRRANAMTFADDKFVVVGTGLRTAVSEDGITWHDNHFASEDGGRAYNAVAFGNGRWVTVGSPSALAWSDDAKNWTDASKPELVGDFANLVFDGQKFVTCARSGCFTSQDGKTWVQSAGSITDPRPTRAMVFQDGLYVGVDAPATLMTSSDGATWTPVYCGEAPALTSLTFVKN